MSPTLHLEAVVIFAVPSEERRQQLGPIVPCHSKQGRIGEIHILLVKK
jgi:hypothetical protein